MQRSISELPPPTSVRGLVTVAPQDRVAVAVSRMNTYVIGSVLVYDGDALKGIFTERDVLVRVVEPGLDPNEVRVREVMTHDPTTIDATRTVSDAIQLMDREDVQHLPVIDGGTVVRVLSSHDVLTALAAELGAENRELHQYIHGPVSEPTELFVP